MLDAVPLALMRGAIALAEAEAASKLPEWMPEWLQQHPVMGWLWIAIPVVVGAIVAIVSFGDALSGFLEFVGIGNPFQRSLDDDQLLDIRRKLLKEIDTDVKGRLANSLHELVKLDLYMEDQRRRVGKPEVNLVPADPHPQPSGLQALINRVFRSKQGSTTIALPATQKLVEVFDRPDVGGKLLILGEPGSGKTTELLHLAQDLTERACQEDSEPIPVIFELSAWDGKGIEDWIAGELKQKFGPREAITKQWLENYELLPLLDGLDELGLERQRRCIEAINQFLSANRVPGLVVCCRREEYEAGGVELTELEGAVYLEVLREGQIEQYFEKLNRRSVWEGIKANPTLLELVKKPLFLSVLVVAYQGKPIGNETELFDAYVEKKLHDPDSQGTYPPGKSPSPERTRHYLAWLAWQLERVGNTEFLIEGLQPSWLMSQRERIYYRLSVGLSFLGLEPR